MNRKAFTLVELSIVILLIGMLLAGGSSGMQWLTKLTQNIESEDIIKANKDAVISFGTNSKVLPDGTQILTLGNQNSDTWGNDVSYYYDANLTLSNNICNKQTTSLSVIKCPDLTCATPTQTINNVAFILVSDGYNNISQTTLLTGDLKVYDNSVEVGGNPYDDLVSWMTIDELRVKSSCNRERLLILNNELPYGYTGSTYITEIYAQGGIAYTPDLLEWSYSFSPALTCTDNLVSNQASSLELTCLNPAADTHLMSVTVSDNDSNSFTKEFVLTINH